MELLTCNLTFHKDNVDHLVNDKGGHTPRHKAEIEMHDRKELASTRLYQEVSVMKNKRLCDSK